MFFPILLAIIVAIVVFLQFEERWWSGMLCGVLLFVVSLGFVISGLEQDVSSPYSLSFPAMYFLAAIGVVIAVTSVVTVLLRSAVSRSKLVKFAFLLVFIGGYVLGWVLVFTGA